MSMLLKRMAGRLSLGTRTNAGPIVAAPSLAMFSRVYDELLELCDVACVQQWSLGKEVKLRFYENLRAHV